MENTRLSFLFYRYINRMCTEAERQELLGLVSEPRHAMQVRKMLEDVWNDAGDRNLSDEQSDRIIRAIFSQDQGNRRYFSWGRIAAAFLITALCATGIVLSLSPFSQKGILTESSKQESFPSFRKLPDGSTVILNTGSTLQFGERFDERTREVFLEGEGFFDIVEDAERPFIVHTGKLRTTVLGTAFNIKAWPEQESIIVTVKRGSVKVGNDREVFAIVNRDQQVRFDRTPAPAKPAPVDSRQVISWIEKDIFFDDVTMEQAVDQLVKRFDVHVSIANTAIKDCRFTATFVKGESFQQILSILCEFNDASLSRNGQTGYVISGGACPTVAEPNPDHQMDIHEPDQSKL